MLKGKLYSYDDAYRFVSVHSERPMTYSFYADIYKINHFVRYIVQRAFPDIALPSTQDMSNSRSRHNRVMPLIVDVDVTDQPYEARGFGWTTLHNKGRNYATEGDPNYVVLGLPGDNAIVNPPYTLCRDSLEFLFDRGRPEDIFIKVTGVCFRSAVDERDAFWKKIGEIITSGYSVPQPTIEYLNTFAMVPTPDKENPSA